MPELAFRPGDRVIYRNHGIRYNALVVRWFRPQDPLSPANLIWVSPHGSHSGANEVPRWAGDSAPGWEPEPPCSSSS